MTFRITPSFVIPGRALRAGPESITPASAGDLGIQIHPFRILLLDKRIFQSRRHFSRVMAVTTSS
jgi:hypothetical protein